jgi:hypothetical protein
MDRYSMKSELLLDEIKHILCHMVGSEIQAEEKMESHVLRATF